MQIKIIYRKLHYSKTIADDLTKNSLFWNKMWLQVFSTENGKWNNFLTERKIIAREFLVKSNLFAFFFPVHIYVYLNAWNCSKLHLEKLQPYLGNETITRIYQNDSIILQFGYCGWVF